MLTDELSVILDKNNILCIQVSFGYINLTQ